MAWTETTRARYERHSGRYASDLTDQEWGLIAPFLPPPKTTGRPRSTAMRDVLDAILYIASAGCAWRLPALSPARLRPRPRSIGPEIGNCPALIALGRSGSLWDALGRADRLSLPLAVSGAGGMNYQHLHSGRRVRRV